ncbi:MAG TPA: PfkB family carbohydrate kinase [Candidatus Aminicenantes bacterium]|nr:PfkB family carbohydrate kinase [Candidatus Aminicenantes bacterium]
MKEDAARLISLVDRFPLLRIAVWGDFILDEYLYGFTRRISREAPVMVISYRNREYALGGAGNAAYNLAALGVEVEAVGVVGRDETGRDVRRLLRRAGIADGSILAEQEFATPLKTRILAGEENTKKQQILRIDREGEVPGIKPLHNKMGSLLKKAAGSCDALLVSDYHSRTVTEGIYETARDAFRAAGRPVAVDSRFRLVRFKGCTIATPNEPEVEIQMKTAFEGGTAVLIAAGRALQRKLQSPALLITRGSQGMALFERGKPPYLLPVFGSTDIVDVTGAGDTVIAVFTAVLAAGGTFREAARLANFAGGLVVMKKGTAVVSSPELKQAVLVGN